MKIGAAILCGVVVITSGCASIFTGTSDPITFESQPDGAKVQINGMRVGRTPVTALVKRSLSAPQVKISLDGYEPQNIMIQNSFNSIAILDIFFWPGFIIDAATGSIMKYSILNYHVRLDPKK